MPANIHITFCVYDMCKALGKDAVISDVRLERKEGGVGGSYQRGED